VAIVDLTPISPRRAEDEDTAVLAVSVDLLRGLVNALRYSCGCDDCLETADLFLAAGLLSLEIAGFDDDSLTCSEHHPPQAHLVEDPAPVRVTPHGAALWDFVRSASNPYI
jgi:hypothetical protein